MDKFESERAKQHQPNRTLKAPLQNQKQSKPAFENPQNKKQKTCDNRDNHNKQAEFDSFCLLDLNVRFVWIRLILEQIERYSLLTGLSG